jgi:hypothetical protein
MRRALHQLLQKRDPAEQLAETERIERGYLGTLLRLTLLAPDLMEAILNGLAPRVLSGLAPGGLFGWSGCHG